MKKIITEIIIVFTITITSQAQTIEKKWGFGADIGAYSNLHNGNIGMMPEAYLSRFLSPSFDLMADVALGYFGNKVISEPLDIMNTSLKLRYKFYNGKIMPIRSKFQPYLNAGLGFMFDNARNGLNFNAGGGVKYPVNKTFSFFTEIGYLHGIDSERDTKVVGVKEPAHDNFMKAVVGIEISFLRQPDGDKDGIIDILDECPDTPKGAIVDENGCPSDSDADGVYDGIDKCPDTPTGAPIDNKGCPLDSDNDGVIDLYDRCPDTPKRTEVDEKGCPIDTDGDGVYDINDDCPNTPAGTEVDEKGCPVDKDSDDDGVMDSADKCPDTPNSAVVDKDGCIDPQATIEMINPSLKPVYFETNKYNVSQNQFSKVDNLVKILNDYPEFKINVYGHADPRGSEALNKNLSDNRAKSVKELLLERNVPEERIRTKAFGEEMAPEGNLTPEQLQEERKAATYMFITIED